MLNLLALATLLEAKTELAIKGLDPIELQQGREVQGDPRFSVKYLRHEYRFASSARLKQFQKDPVAYAAQNGGACGKMGALTGKGSPDRFAVVNGKLFFFASDGCRTTFMASKDKYFASVGRRPAVRAVDKEAASSVFSKALKAHGGRSLRALKGLFWTLETPYKEDGLDKVWKTNWSFLAKDRYAHWEEWDKGRLFFVVNGKKAAEGKPGEVYGVHPGELRALDAMFTRHPVGILLGNGAGVLTPLKAGKGWTMAKGDIVFDVTLDDETSRIRSISYHDRAAGPVADVVVEYSDYVQVEGAWLPTVSRSKVDDGEWSAPRRITYRANAGVPQVFHDAGAGF
ncbi:MAG: hypothetical protein JST30_13090 [Armatimonadetes bacterium]|nr:hypothetical protein [Armatimonadota bacterium]